jgi:diaminohydroxyphosphoribosylaminopyrimidine deaminase/5-amino-6-(5-phosphoribosylamino)uracil reductase
MATLAGRSIILTCSSDSDKQHRLQQAGFEVYVLPEAHGRLDLSAVMPFLASLQINDLLVEAGAILNGALLTHDLIDETIIYMASCVLGDQGRGLFHLPALHNMADKKILKLRDVRHVGADLKLTLTAS